MATYLAWMQYFSWFMYANEAMSIIQWDGVENISKLNFRRTFYSIIDSIIEPFHILQLAIRQCLPVKIYPACTPVPLYWSSTHFREIIWPWTCGLCVCCTLCSMVWRCFACGDERREKFAERYFAYEFFLLNIIFF